MFSLNPQAFLGEPIGIFSLSVMDGSRQLKRLNSSQGK